MIIAALIGVLVLAFGGYVWHQKSSGDAAPETVGQKEEKRLPAPDIVLILGVGLVILAVVGRVNTSYFEVDVRSARKRMVLGVGGLALVVAFFSGELATLYRSLFHAVTTSVVLIEPVETGSLLSQDAKYVGDKTHRNLAELLSNVGHRVIAPPLSVAANSSENNMSKVLSIKLTPDGGNLAIHVALADADGSLIASTELTGPLSELKESYKVLPEAILFGLDVDERTLEAYCEAAYNERRGVRPLFERSSQTRFRGCRSRSSSLGKAIALDKKFAMAYWSLGTLMAEQDKTSEARNFVEEANRLDPDHPKELSDNNVYKLVS